MTNVEKARFPQPLIDLLPEFAAELAQALRGDGDVGLEGQVPGLTITALCWCGDDFCASFYTGPRPDGSWGAGHECITPMTATVMIILDVVDGRIRYVEVLHRDDVRSTISMLVE